MSYENHMQAHTCVHHTKEGYKCLRQQVLRRTITNNTYDRTCGFELYTRKNNAAVLVHVMMWSTFTSFTQAPQKLLPLLQSAADHNRVALCVRTHTQERQNTTRVNERSSDWPKFILYFMRARCRRCAYNWFVSSIFRNCLSPRRIQNCKIIIYSN